MSTQLSDELRKIKKENQKLKDEVGALNATKTCLIDYDDVRVTDGIECLRGHFICGDCVSTAVKVQLGEYASFKERGMRIACPICLQEDVNTKVLYDVKSIILFGDVFDRISEARARDKIEEEVNARVRKLEEERRNVGKRIRNLADDALNAAMLALRCPRCSTPLVMQKSFDDCFALYCDGCACRPCGWCLQDGTGKLCNSLYVYNLYI